MDNDFEKKINLKKRARYFLWSLLFLSILSITTFGIIVTSIPKETESKTKETEDLFSSLNIKAESYIVYDVVSKKVISEKNPDTPKPLASLTKVMTALTAYEILPKHSTIKIIEDYMSPEGDSGLNSGDTWVFENLADFTLVTSSNDGAHALASVAQASTVDNSTNFVKEMNRVAEEVGMTNSKFFNEHGLDRTIDRGGAYGSARDVATLFEYILKNRPEILEATRYPSISVRSTEQNYEATNTNTFINQIPWILASKTGYTDLAGGNLAVAYDAGIDRPIIVVVLGSTQEDRFTDTLALIDSTMKFINKENTIE